ncbi:MAG: PepSY-associated TM helix domain-containing protein [Bacteroidales bacterium]
MKKVLVKKELIKAEKKKGNSGTIIRKWSRTIHRDLSFFFSGIILVYAFSGIFLNHKADFNSNYSIKKYDFVVEGNYPLIQSDFSAERVKTELLTPYDETKNYTKHYFPDSLTMKVFLKGGSSMVLSLETGKGVYESVKKRQIISSINRLHYNPNKWWTIFSDIFIGSLIIITITGLIMNKGKKGIMGRGGIELIIGIIIPLLFIFLT